MLEEYGRICVEILQRDDSQVPVRTGELKRSYGYRVTGGQVYFTNDEVYADFHNDHLVDTLEAASDEIERRLNEWLAEELQNG